MSFRVALTIAALLFESNLYALSSMKVLNKRIIFGSTNNGNNYVPMETKATKESTAEGTVIFHQICIHRRRCIRHLPPHISELFYPFRKRHEVKCT